MGPEKVKCPNCGKVNNVPAAGGKENPAAGTATNRFPGSPRPGGTVTFRRLPRSPRCLYSSISGRRGARRAAWSARRSSSSPQNVRVRSSWSRSTSMLLPQMAERFTVRAVPTLLVMNRGGEVLARQAGAARFASCARGWMRHSRKMQTRTLNHDLCSSGGPTRDRHPGRHAPGPRRLRGMSSPRHPVGASAPLPDVRTRRLLRLLARQARKRTRSRHRPSDRPVAGTR